jgi:hypothetical protein
LSWQFYDITAPALLAALEDGSLDASQVKVPLLLYINCAFIDVMWLACGARLILKR